VDGKWRVHVQDLVTRSAEVWQRCTRSARLLLLLLYTIRSHICAAVTRRVLQGSMNNLMVVCPSIEFTMDAPKARHVSVVGDWDDWTYSVPLERSPHSGMWHGHALLTAGQYHYQFIVDDHVAHNPFEPVALSKFRGPVNTVGVAAG
jgi:1,4-alpha-glucan branching enzyme